LPDIPVAVEGPLGEIRRSKGRRKMKGIPSVDDSGDYSFVLDKEKKPVRIVKPDEKFIVHTKDAVNGKIYDESVLFTKENLEPMSLYSPELSNPVYGPVYVEGAKKGDLLAVRINDIRPKQKGLTGIKPTQGLFHDSRKWSQIYKAPHTKILTNKLEKGEVVFSDRIRWRMNPFIGTIGVAPEVEVHASSVIQGPWGGNWDCHRICKGSTIYFNVYNDGGLLYLGDVHGSQGDGELSGIANEIAADVEIAIGVVPQKLIPYARIETDTHLICICASKPLERAVENSIDYLMDWIRERSDLNARDIFMILSTCPDFKIEIYQMVDMPGISFTAGASLPKSLLSSR
jgi:acetamidase/formamidase